MTLPAFILSVIILLMTPGPTNTLMALAGYQRGWRQAAPLIGAEITAYVVVVVAVATCAAPVFEQWPSVALAAKLLAAAWVFTLSVKLWSLQPNKATGTLVDTRTVFWTTCLNPKALIIGLAIMPHGGIVPLLPWLAVLALLILAAANGWILFGTLLRRNGLQNLSPAFVRRVSAAGLFMFATLLTAGGLHGLT